MTGRIAVACLALGICGLATAQEPSKAAVKKLADEVGTATIKGDYAKIIDVTHEGIVKKLGGREEGVKIIEKGMKELVAKGFTFTKYTVSDPGNFHTEGANTFVVVPSVLEMKSPTGKVLAKSYLLGISPDGGKTWKFADGAGMANKELRESMLPKMPAALKLPDPQPPEIVKD